MAQAQGQDKRVHSPQSRATRVSTWLWPFCVGHFQVPFSTPPHPLSGPDAARTACEEPTSCLRVSLAMISLWSMRDSSSTSSSD